MNQVYNKITRFLLVFIWILLLLVLPTSVLATTYHTITIDGNNDFASDEDFSGTSGSTWYFTWDLNNFYFGITANDVNDNSSTKWVVLYLDADPAGTNGATYGVTYNTQQPALGFNADYHFRWRTDNAYINMLDFNNSTGSWTDDNTGANNFGISGFQSGTFVEFMIPRASLGNPSSIRVAGAMLNEAAFVESTFFLIPGDTSINGDGYDRNLGTYFQFLLVGGISPDGATPTSIVLQSLTVRDKSNHTGILVILGIFLSGSTWLFLRRRNVQRESTSHSKEINQIINVKTGK